MSKVGEHHRELKEMGIYKNVATALKDMLGGEDEFIDEDLYMEHIREKK